MSYLSHSHHYEGASTAGAKTDEGSADDWEEEYQDSKDKSPDQAKKKKRKKG